MSPAVKNTLIAVGFLLSALFGLFGILYKPSPQIAPEPTPQHALAPPAPDEFDMSKRDRQILWCEHHDGVPTITFTRDGSNVLCLRPEAIIVLPEAK